MIIYCLFLHFVADFLLQSREMGKKKSMEFKWLAMHLGIQFSVFTLGMNLFLSWQNALLLSGLNAIVHGAIDWHIWRIYKWSVFKRFPDANESFKYYEDHFFYSTIGLDQFLHGSTLVLLCMVFHG